MYLTKYILYVINEFNSNTKQRMGGDLDLEKLEKELRKIFEKSGLKVDVYLDDTKDEQMIALSSFLGTKNLQVSLDQMRLLGTIFQTSEINVVHPGFFQNSLRIIIKAGLHDRA